MNELYTMKSVLRKAKTGISSHNQAVIGKFHPPRNVHFLTFTNTEYMQPTRILREAESFRFTSILWMNEHDIPDVVERHRDFITANPMGYGLWIWKPSVILEGLRRIPENDSLLYCDAGMHLNRDGLLRYYDYVSKLDHHDMVVFHTPEVYEAQHYVKRDAVDVYFPEFADRRDRYHYAGFMLLKNTPTTRAILTEWRDLCEIEHFLDGSDSVSENVPGFQGSDFDNGLWNLCLAKHSGVYFSVSPWETNLYDSTGYQYHGKTTEKDWEILRLFPFQVRRLRPSR